MAKQKWNRREFIKDIAALGGSVATYSHYQQYAFAQAGLKAIASAAPRRETDILVVVFLRGGCDGLHFLAPAGDPLYHAARTADTKLKESGEGAGLRLNAKLGKSEFLLHPEAKPLQELFRSQQLLFVHACGLTHGSRSHFDAEDLMERGVAEDKFKSIASGWLTRYLDQIKAGGDTPAVSVSDTLPISLLQYQRSFEIPAVDQLSYWGDQELLGPIGSTYASFPSLRAPATEARLLLKKIDTKIAKKPDGGFVEYIPEPRAQYAEAQGLKTLAHLIKLNLGIQVATLDYSGWDTHENQGDRFSELTRDLSRNLASFYNDIWRFQKRVTVVVMTEFGRRLKANESRGTDHGHGSIMMVLGGGLHGGKLYGNWPGLSAEHLDNQVDLAVTTDYRAILSEILAKRMRTPKLDLVFPGFTWANPLGIC